MATLAKLLVGLGLDASEYDKGLDKAEQKADGFGSKIGGFLGGAMKAGLAATAGGVIAAIGGIVKGVASNAEFERYETQFGVLLGSTDKAKARLQDLAKFGAQTPFELPEVVKADKILQGFGLHSEEAAKKFGFSGEQIRTIAGDVASGTGSSFEEMSLLLGKFSAGATGEAISRMAELGIASRQDLAKMGLEFDKSGALLSPLPKAMNVVLQLMKDKYGGMMQAQSSTFEGMISNLQDWVSGTLRTISAPIFEVVKDKLGALLAFLNDPATMAALDSFAQSLATGVAGAMDFLSTTAIPALITAWQTIWPLLQTAGTFIGTVIVPNVMNLATWIGNNLPAAIAVLLGIWATIQPALATVVDFIEKHADAIFAGLVAILLTVVVPAFIAWAASAASAAVATVAAMLPILVPLALIGAAVALLYEAWNTNFLGIRDILVDVWQNYLQPAFSAIWDWLSVNVPAAIQTLANFWNNTLLPALNAVWSFLSTYIIPIFIQIATNTINTFKAAIQTLANFWTNILKPAITAVWTFLNTYIIPIFKAITNVYIAAFNLALRLLAAVWNNIIMPALTKAWSYINTYVIPIFKMLYDQIIDKGLKPALQSVAFFILGTLIPQFMAVKNTISANLSPALSTAQSALAKVRDAFGWIDSAIKSTISWIQKVADKLNSISIPDWLQGHSPPPMAHWFRYIAEAAQFANDEFDAFNRQMMNGQLTQPQVPMGINGIAAQAVQSGPQLSITAQYDYQDERTVRDEVRMQAMLLGITPTG